MNARVISLAISSLFVLPLAAPQNSTSASTAIAASAPTPVPALIPYSGSALDAQGKPLADSAAMTFLIYKDEQGGQPLFAETQAVAVDTTGHYKVQLGASLSSGIPIDLFSSGEARWIEVQIAGQPSQPRVLLVSVPYALKAADAATLGGLPASAFALAGSKATVAAAGVSPDAATDVTTTGGTTGYLPQFSGAATVIDSPVFVSGADVGVGTATPTATLDVNGTTILNGATTINGATSITGALTLPATGTATASAGFNSEELKMYTSAYNSSTKAVVDPRFYWEAEVGANDTAAPTATLNLLSSTTTSGTTETGFHFNANGTLNFAPGQTFPGGSGTITGVTAGTALTGGGTTGTVTLNVDTTKVPLLTTPNSFTGNQNVTGNVGATGGLYGTYAILTGQLTSASASLGIASASTLAATGSISALDGVFAQNTFTALASPVATANGGGSSFLYQEASIYNSSTQAVTTPIFAWGAVPLANNSASPSSQLALYYGPGNGGVSQTGLSINPKGLFTFASGQTFPGTGPGTITGVTASSPLTGGGTSGSVAVGLNTAALESTLNGTYAQLSAPNTFTSTLISNGVLEATKGITVPLGVGTSLPQYDLEVYGGSASSAELAMVSSGTDAAISVNNTNTSNGGREYWIDSGSSGAGVGEGNFAIYDRTANATRLVVNSDGQVGIPTINEIGHLTVTASELDGIGILAYGAYLPGEEGTPGIDGLGGSTDGSSGVPGGQAGLFEGGDADTAADGGLGLYAQGGFGSNNQEGTSAQFDSDIEVNGTTVSDVFHSQIDHPLDPANKYLNHTSVQSSEMMNIYSGNVVSDEFGLATVKLPDWFEAENTDFRYQLTVLDERFAQAVVSKEIANHQFTIHTNASRVKVSWQVTGVRQDAYAKAHPMIVEEAKPAREVGFYHHPELFGQPREKGTEWGRNPKMMQRMAAQRADSKARQANATSHPVPVAKSQLKPVAHTETN